MERTNLERVVKCKGLKFHGGHRWRELSHSRTYCRDCEITFQEWVDLMHRTLEVRLHPILQFTLVCPHCASKIVTPRAPYPLTGQPVQMVIQVGLGMCPTCHLPFKVTEAVAKKHNEPLEEWLGG